MPEELVIVNIIVDLNVPRLIQKDRKKIDQYSQG